VDLVEQTTRGWVKRVVEIEDPRLDLDQRPASNAIHRYGFNRRG
jgi:hypothetical protein